MARGKTIQLFLMDSVPSGRVKCTLANWTEISYKIPRTELDKCKERDDLKQSGVYFLFGISDQTGRPVVYIGQAGARKNGDGILNRLQEHKRSPEKDYWTEAVDKKRVLYERLVLKQISMGDYKTQKATVDNELDRLREIHSKLKMQTSQMQMKEKEKSAKTELAQEVVGAGGLTAGLADTLIDRVYVYPGNQVEVVWKMKDFCIE